MEIAETIITVIDIAFILYVLYSVNKYMARKNRKMDKKIEEYNKSAAA